MRTNQQVVDPNNIESDFMRAKRLQNERNPFTNYAAAVGQSIGQAGANVAGLFSPELGQRMGRNVDAYYGPNTGGVSGFVGGAVGAAGQAIPALATGGMTSAVILAGQFGASGAGGVRREVADLRDAGQEVSGLEEFGTAAGVGAVEAASGAISALMFGAFGKAAEGLLPAAKQAFASGGKKGLASFMSRAAGTAGAATAEGLEEGATQYATGRIRQAGINDEIDPWEGVVESALTGVALSPILGPIAHGANARSRAGAQADEGDAVAEEAPTDTEQLFGPVTGKGEIDTAPKASQDAGAAQTALADLGNESGEYTAADIQKYVGGMEGEDGASLVISMMEDGPYVVVEAPVDMLNENVLQAGDIDAGKAQDAADQIAAGNTAPPVIVGKGEMLADGTHRLLQYRKSGKATIGAVMSKAQAAKLGLTPINVRGGVSQQANARQQAPAISTQPVKPGPARSDTDTTSARKADIDGYRKSLGLHDLPSPERRAWADVLKKSQDTGIPDRAMGLAATVNADPRPMTDVETAGMTLKAAELKNQHRTLSRQLAATADEAQIAVLAAEVSRVQQDFDVLTQAIRVSGTEKGRALAAHRLTINQDYDLISVVSRARVAKKAKLSSTESESIKRLVTELGVAENRAVRAEKAFADREASDILSRTAGRRRKSKTVKTDRDMEILFAKARDLMAKGCS